MSPCVENKKQPLGRRRKRKREKKKKKKKKKMAEGITGLSAALFLWLLLARSPNNWSINFAFNLAQWLIIKLTASLLRWVKRADITLHSSL